MRELQHMTINREEMAEEILLRENIRNAIKLVIKRREDTKNEALQEEKMLRDIVRKLIKEEVSDSPSKSTAINVLEELLGKIIPVIEEDFKSLTTNKEQRESFRAHVVNGIENLIAPAEVNADAGEEEAIEELLQRVNELKISLGDDMPPEFIDIYGDDDDDDEEEPASEEEEFAKGLDDRDYDLVGRNMALRSFKKIQQNILDSYAIVSPDEEDREVFYDYLLTNVKLYFDKFEEEIDPNVEEPTTSEYEEQESSKNDAPDEFSLQEYVDLDELLEGIQ
jgi:hypothetical protein|tara:strand:- start:2 stop:841 length:840 start_codon:yes stop_codon:yes gene_type:complete